MRDDANGVPGALKTWFIIHFAADIVFALPLLIAPEAFLGFLGWEVVNPMSARLVGAALVGIGTESFLCRNDGLEVFRALLRLKVLWSAAAVAGLLFTQLQGAPPMGWAFLAIFAAFHLLWDYWLVRVRRLLAQGSL
jgi:hypothetical protein